MRKGIASTDLGIIIILVAVLVFVFFAFFDSRVEEARLAKTIYNMNALSESVLFYTYDHKGEFPPESNHFFPENLKKYILGDTEGSVLQAPWPGSYFDWDNFPDPENPGTRYYQMSIRFCEPGANKVDCHFPKEEWAKDFDSHSSVYYCFKGNCRADPTKPRSYPGYCINCGKKEN